jgi:hypothetical protein
VVAAVFGRPFGQPALALRAEPVPRLGPSGFDPGEGNVPLGLYRVQWKEGGESLAAVGMNEKGERWIAPTNWIRAGMLSTEGWGAVERLFPIKPLTEGRIVDCPRCHQQCGWCSDPRWMHGQLKLPGSKKRCTIDLAPEGENCPLCFGEHRVVARTDYAPIARIEAGTDETRNAAQPVGREPDKLQGTAP